MNNLIINFINITQATFNSIPYGKEILVFIISIMPILELRGGLIAAKILGLSVLDAYIICIIGNIIPVFFLLILVEKIYHLCKNCNCILLNKIANILDDKVKKHSSTINKYGILALILFVGIPLPGTGAWTGCVLAGLLKLNKTKSFIAIMIGIIMASIIMLFISYGIPYLLSISSMYSLA